MAESSGVKTDAEGVDEPMATDVTDTDTEVSPDVEDVNGEEISAVVKQEPQSPPPPPPSSSSGLKMVIKLGQRKAGREKTSSPSSDKKVPERSHDEIQKEPLRNDGYCTSALSALDPAIYALLTDIVGQKITRDRPHFCMFCGHRFISGSGVYIHYYRHKVTDDRSQPRRRRRRQRQRSKSTKAVAVDGIKVEPDDDDAPPSSSPSSSSLPPPSSKKKPPTTAKSAKVIVNGGQSVTTSKQVAVATFDEPTTTTTTSTMAAVATSALPSTTGYVKPFPTRLLPAKTMKMLRELLKQRITVENPHLCKVCQHPFYSGCGIYIHYLKHYKKNMKPVRAGATSLTNTKQRIRKKSIERSSKNGAATTVAISKKTLQTPTTTTTMNHAAMLDTKTLLMLRDIATRISPEDPHVCEICEHAFYNARGIQAHYLKHAKQKLSKGDDEPPIPILIPEETATSAKRKKGGGVVEVNKKPSPLDWLRPTVLSMLQSVVREGISDDKPHTCKFCPKVFVRGTGLYFHYLQHKGATKVSVAMNAPVKANPVSKATAAATAAVIVVPSVSLAMTKTASAKAVAANKKSTKKLVKKKSLPSKKALQINAKLPPRPPPPRMPTHAAKSLSHPSANSRYVAVGQPIINALDTAAKVSALSGNGGGGGRKRDTAFVLCQLEHNTKKLLYHLTKDVEVLQSFGWPQKDASSIVDEILGVCNVTPMRRSSQFPSRKLECLRSNVLKLIKFCIRDEVMVAKGWKNKLVDDAVKEIIATEGNFSGDLLK